jgi:hypothetical protein
MVFASAAFGDGTYERTKDGKTIVWNNEPRPDDTAAWWGDRDRDGYATGFGTLTWYIVQQQIGNGSSVPSTKYVVYARYFGNMVRGKFDGPVNVHSKGKTAHAIFVDGKRSSHWAAGPAPSRRVAMQRVEPAKQEAAAKPAFPEGPGAARPEAPGEGPPTARAVAKKREEPVHTQAKTEPPSPAAGPSVRPERTVNVNRPPVRRVPKLPTSKKSQAEVEESLRSLVGPPSALRTNPAADGPSVETKPEAASSPSANAGLTKKEVVDLADGEARTRGYDLAEYERPDARYNAADNTWSLSYDQKKSVNGMADIGKHFSVTVDDKTKETSIVPGR